MLYGFGEFVNRSGLIISLLLVASTPVFCAECESGTITTLGSAVRTNPPDVVELRFKTEFQSNSFTEASQRGEELRGRLEQLDPIAEGPVSLSVRYDLGLLGQKRLSWSKGRKLEAEFVLTLQNLPTEHSKKYVVQVIDRTLTLDPSLVLEHIVASLSDLAASKLEIEAMSAAVGDARRHAETLAKAASLRVSAVHSVHTALPSTSGYIQELRLDGANISSFLQVRKKFTVEAGMEAIEVSAAVVGQFCVE